jgi:thioredoxin 1
MLLSVNARTFKQEVLEASTPTIVHFWAPWCSMCRMIEPILTSCQTSWGEQIKLVGINADQSLQLASQYRLTTLPTIILFEGGEVRFRSEGGHHRDELHKTLQSLIFKLVNQRQGLLPQSEYDVTPLKTSSL